MTDMKTWTTPAGWYPDSERPGQQRFWDGQQWTQHMAPAPMQPQAPAAPKASGQKRPWLIAIAFVFGLFVLGGVLGGEPESPTPVADVSDDDDAAVAADAADPAAASVSVPDVVGLDEGQAEAELEDAGLDVSIRREDVDAAEGEVVRQSPKAGKDAQEGDTVTLGVSTGIVRIDVPDVVGMTLTNGRDTLDAEGFDVDVTKAEDDSVPAGEILEQSPTGEAEEGDTISLIVAKAPAPEMTSGQENALRSAEDYLDFAAFSREGLIRQLEFEDYSTADATFAVDHVAVNWKQQAAESARDYLEFSPFSRQGLIDQLVFEGFTHEQATYGVDQAM